MSPGPHFTLELERSDRRGALGTAEKESEPHAKGFLSSLHPHERGFAGSHFDRTNLDRVPCFSSATRCGPLLLCYGGISRKAIGSNVKILPPQSRCHSVFQRVLRASSKSRFSAARPPWLSCIGGWHWSGIEGPGSGVISSGSSEGSGTPIRIGTFRRL